MSHSCFGSLLTTRTKHHSGAPGGDRIHPDVISTYMSMRCCMRRVHFLRASADSASPLAEGVSPFAALCIGIINCGDDTRAWSRLLGAVHVGSSFYWDGIEPTSVASHRALLVGVNSYDDRDHFSPLSLSIGDARSVGGVLEPLGYEVTYSLDPTRDELVSAVESFSKNLVHTRLAIVHFSGHGFAPTRESFLSAKDSKCTFRPGGLISCLLTCSPAPRCVSYYVQIWSHQRGLAFTGCLRVCWRTSTHLERS
jgi:hypothetical protein